MDKQLRASLLFVLIGVLLLSACGTGAASPSPVLTTASTAAGASPTATTVPASGTTAPPPTTTAAADSATVGEVVNLVEARPPETESFVQVGVGYVVNVGGQVHTGDDSIARLDFGSGTILRLAANTSFVLQAISPQDGGLFARLKLEAGKIWASLLGGGVDVETPVGVAAVRGSFAIIEFLPGDPNDPSDDVFIVQCLEGHCTVQFDGTTIELGTFGQLTLRGSGRQIRQTPGCLHDEDVERFVHDNPESQGLIPTLTQAPPARCATPTSTPTKTNTPRPRLPTLTPTLTNTPPPSCPEGEFFDPVMNRCNPKPYGAPALGSSPLYQALARTQRASLPVGPVSGALTLVGIVTLGWVYRRRNRP